jgi:hypothetical protein
VANVAVQTWRSAGTGIGTGDDVYTGQATTTDANGIYGFGGLAPDDYFVKFTAPAGYNFTVAGQGNDDTGSDADVTSGITPTTTLTSRLGRHVG